MGLLRHGLLKRLNETHNDSPAAGGSAVRRGRRRHSSRRRRRVADSRGTRSGTRRGAKIYAELVGFAASQDTYKITEPDPTGRSYARAITGALSDGGSPPMMSAC